MPQKPITSTIQWAVLGAGFLILSAGELDAQARTAAFSGYVTITVIDKNTNKNYRDAYSQAPYLQDFAFPEGVGSPQCAQPPLQINGVWQQSACLAQSDGTQAASGITYWQNESSSVSQGVLVSSLTWNGFSAAGVYNWVSTRFLDLTSGAYFASDVGTTFTASGPFGANQLTQSVFNMGFLAPSFTDVPGAPVTFASTPTPSVGFDSPPQILDISDAPNGSPVSAIAADGSAVVCVFQSSSSTPISIDLGAASPLTVAPFDSNALQNSQGGTLTSLPTVAPLDPECQAGGNTCIFIALIWAPATLPSAAFPPTNPQTIIGVPVTVSVTQDGATQSSVLTLVPPPLALIHGFWSKASVAWEALTIPGPDDQDLPISTPAAGGNDSFFNFLQRSYPHSFIDNVDYGGGVPDFSSRAFNDPDVQQQLYNVVTGLLSSALHGGLQARSVDVVAHSNGGLVTRYFMSTHPASHPIHQLITVGTPHLGSNLAQTLWDKQLYSLQARSVPVEAACIYYSLNPCSSTACYALWDRKSSGYLVPYLTCTLSRLFTAMKRPVAGAVSAFRPNTDPLNQLNSSPASFGYTTIAGAADGMMCGGRGSLSCTEWGLDQLIGAFLPGQSVQNILQASNDTIVSVDSQLYGGANSIPQTIHGIVHADLTSGWTTDVGETASRYVWFEALYLLAGQAPVDPFSASTARTKPRTAAGPAPDFDFDSMTFVTVDNATLSPLTNTTLAPNAPVSIAANSSTKTVSQLLLQFNPADPADPFMLYTTQSPFTISYTPNRLGSVALDAFVSFTDGTYTIVPLAYPIATSDTLASLILTDAPQLSLPIGSNSLVHSRATYLSNSSRSYQLDVSPLAAYSTGSGTQSVFSAGPGGAITANGPGVDILDVTYGGQTVSAPISVGNCSFRLGPASQLTGNSGGIATLLVTATSGCGWTAGSSASWAAIAPASGSGNGSVSVTLQPNASGNGPRFAVISVAGQTAQILQSDEACTFSALPAQITVAAAGGYGSIPVTASCPVLVSSDAGWLKASAQTGGAGYWAPVNTTGSARSASLTVGPAEVSITQLDAGCDLKLDGNINVSDVQLLINEALGAAAAVNHLNASGLVNIVDIQMEINAIIGLGCAAG